MTFAIPVVTVSGDPVEAGRAHARATAHLRGEVAAYVEDVRRRFGGEAVASGMDDISQALRQHSPDTLGHIEGMADVYGLDAREMLVSVLQTYFEGLGKVQAAADQGCTTYAYASERGAVLVKNRDSSGRFLNMQTILRVVEDEWFSWIALSTAGAPGVHSAGMNEMGLCVADTHVPSRDTGPGLPRFSMMMNVLQRCETVEEALEYCRATPNMGYGNLIVQDAGGHMAVIECGYSQSGVVVAENAFVAATNHFVTSAMADSVLEAVGSAKGLDTRKRKQLLECELGRIGDAVLDNPIAPMQQHVPQPIGSICVHGDRSPTLSTIVMDPVRRVFAVAHGHPCESELVEYSALPQEWKATS